MIVEHLELVDFRNYREASFDLTAGVTAVLGDNGQGKTNFAESLAYLATLSSFRGAPADALVRVGADAGIIRATVRHDDGRTALIEAELSRVGRNRVQLNRQRLGRTRDLLGTVRVTVFSPDDLTLIKGGPGDRRRFMDDVLVALAVKYDSMRLEIDRVVKQRNTLLKHAGGVVTDEVAATLEVWDAKLAALAEPFGHARATLVARLTPMVMEAYARLAGAPTPIELIYEPAWRRAGLVTALHEARRDDLRRGVSTVGPHRDELELQVNGLPSRTHASQGEQRTLALALRLGAHQLVAERTGSSPVLVLDDVLSELDESRRPLCSTICPLARSCSPPPAACRAPRTRTAPSASPPARWLRWTDDDPPDRSPRSGRRTRSGTGASEWNASGARGHTRPARPGNAMKRPGNAMTSSQPIPLTASLDGVMRSLRGGDRRQIGGVFGRWDDAVGEAIAAHVRPVRLDERVLTVEAEDPAWATEVKFLAPTIIERMHEVAGVALERLEIRVAGRR